MVVVNRRVYLSGVGTLSRNEFHYCKHHFLSLQHWHADSGSMQRCKLICTDVSCKLTAMDQTHIRALLAQVLQEQKCLVAEPPVFVTLVESLIQNTLSKEQRSAICLILTNGLIGSTPKFYQLLSTLVELEETLTMMRSYLSGLAAMRAISVWWMGVQDRRFEFIL